MHLLESLLHKLLKSILAPRLYEYIFYSPAILCISAQSLQEFEQMLKASSQALSNLLFLSLSFTSLGRVTMFERKIHWLVIVKPCFIDSCKGMA